MLMFSGLLVTHMNEDIDGRFLNVEFFVSYTAYDDKTVYISPHIMISILESDGLNEDEDFYVSGSYGPNVLPHMEEHPHFEEEWDTVTRQVYERFRSLYLPRTQYTPINQFSKECAYLLDGEFYRYLGKTVGISDDTTYIKLIYDGAERVITESDLKDAIENSNGYQLWPIVKTK